MSVSVQERVGALLRGSGMSLSAAESCTGGMISHLVTVVPGASEYYLGSVTSYAVSVKEKVLDVPAEIIDKNGVVSAPVAGAMARGIRRLTGSTFAVSTTGLAGPGGDENYPEGTVWIGVDGPLGTRTKIVRKDLGREGNIEAFAVAALEFLVSYIENCLESDNQKPD